MTLHMPLRRRRGHAVADTMQGEEAAGRRGLAHWMPSGQTLPEGAWNARHRGILVTLWLHIGALALWSLATDVDSAHSLAEIGPLATVAAGASARGLSRQLRSSLSTAGLVGVSALLVHLMDGHVEAHFHFFLVIAIVTLYQSWSPFAVATVMTFTHHLSLGILAPATVYNHPAAQQRPLLWAVIHVAFVLAVSTAHMVAWRLNEDARRDPLTALTDRGVFEARLTQLLDAGVRTTVLLVDLDDFKRVNDTHGHAVGDSLLVAVARRLLVATRQADEVARFGGDEFAVLLAGVAPDEAAHVAGRLTDALADPFAIAGTEVFVSSSVGMAAADRGAAADLIGDADAAMYVSKRAGKSRWTAFDPAFREESDRRSGIVDQLRVAAEQDRFSLRYNPIVSLLTGSVVGWSAELYWQPPGSPARRAESAAPHRGLLAESGLAIEVGRRSLVAACRELRGSEPQDEHTDAFVDLEVSLRELRQPGFGALVESTLRATGCRPHNIVLTVSECAVLSDDETVTANLSALAELGVWVNLAGFGAGASSIASLRPEVVGAVRLDRSLTGAAGAGVPGARQRSLTVGIVTVANACGLVVMADSTGAPGELVELRRLGVDLVHLPSTVDHVPTRAASAPDAEPHLLVQLDDDGRDVITLPELLHHCPPTAPAATRPAAPRRGRVFLPG